MRWQQLQTCILKSFISTLNTTAFINIIINYFGYCHGNKCEEWEKTCNLPMLTAAMFFRLVSMFFTAVVGDGLVFVRRGRGMSVFWWWLGMTAAALFRLREGRTLL